MVPTMVSRASKNRRTTGTERYQIISRVRIKVAKNRSGSTKTV